MVGKGIVRFHVYGNLKPAISDSANSKVKHIGPRNDFRDRQFGFHFRSMGPTVSWSNMS